MRLSDAFVKMSLKLPFLVDVAPLLFDLTASNKSHLGVSYDFDKRLAVYALTEYVISEYNISISVGV